MNRAYIGNIQITSKYPVLVYGQVRGVVSNHRQVDAAMRSLIRDRRVCRNLGSGAYSDAAVYVFRRDRWEAIDEFDNLARKYA